MYKETMIVWVNGQEMELYTIGKAAKLLKRSVETVRGWERKKIIPRPMFKHKNNVRLYHPLEVEALKKALKKLGKNPKRAEMQTLFWEVLQEARKEILNGPQEEEKKLS